MLVLLPVASLFYNNAFTSCEDHAVNATVAGSGSGGLHARLWDEAGCEVVAQIAARSICPLITPTPNKDIDCVFGATRSLAIGNTPMETFLGNN